jgi:nitrite reductase (NO-forming)
MTDTTSEEARETRAMGMIATLAGVAVALVLSAGALIIVVASGSGGGAGTLAGAAAGASRRQATRRPASASISTTSWSGPASLEVAAGGSVEVVNAGAIPHDLVLEDHGVGTPMLDTGETYTFDTAELEPGTYTVICTVPGHREAGMEGTLTVVGADGEAATRTPPPTPPPTPATAPAATTRSPPPRPTRTPCRSTRTRRRRTGFEARDARLAPAPDQDVHEVTVRASQVEGEVAPGVTQELWTFDEMVPGPVLRGKVGDLFRITFVNDGEMGHSIDFHASKVNPGEEMRTIQPGEELVYEFEAKHAGAWMYHCGTAPVLHHTGNGQYGVVIVDPPDLPEVDHEYVFVQSEFYLGRRVSPAT